MNPTAPGPREPGSIDRTIVRRGTLTAVAILLTFGGLTGCTPQAPSSGQANDSAASSTIAAAPNRGARPLRMGMMPKLVGISYFKACERGAREAAAELGIELDYDGPTVDRVEDQVRMIDRWIAQGYDIIAVAPNDPEVIAPALRRAHAEGVVVLTWDADANPQASQRAVFVNQAPVEAIGRALVDVMAEGIGGEGKVLFVTGSQNSPNQAAWMQAMRRYAAEQHPGLLLLSEPLVSDEDQAKAVQLTRSALAAHPDLAGVWGITSVALPGAAKAVRDAGKSGQVVVTGLSQPQSMAEYVRDGTVERFVLWNPVDLGYLTVQVAQRLATGELVPGAQPMGRLGEIEVGEGEVLLGPPIVFDRENIEQYDF